MLPPPNIHIGVVVTIVVVEVVWIWITIFETIKLHQRPSTATWLAGGRGRYRAMTMDVVCSQLSEVFDRLGTLPQIG